jgi:hypothetical protein
MTVQKAVYTILPKRNKGDLLIRIFIARCSPHSLKISVGNDDIKDLRFFLRYLLPINVPLFKKLRDIIFFLRDNNFMSHFEGHFEGAKTFLTP